MTKNNKPKNGSSFSTNSLSSLTPTIVINRIILFSFFLLDEKEMSWYQREEVRPGVLLFPISLFLTLSPPPSPTQHPNFSLSLVPLFYATHLLLPRPCPAPAAQLVIWLASGAAGMASKPANHNGPPSLNGAAAGPAFPATKAQMYGATRPTYRPQPPKPRRRRSCRGCWCSCCLWLTLILLALVFLVAIAGGIFYVMYRPHRPSFSVSSLRLSALNVTDANALTSRLDVSVTARNPNRKLVYIYDPISISVSTGGVGIGNGSFPAFVHEAKNTTLLKASVTSSGQSLDSATASDLKKKSSLPLQIQLDTNAGVKVGSLKTKKIRIRVSCDGVNVSVPKGKSAPAASSPDATCKVKLRIKIWKWYI